MYSNTLLYARKLVSFAFLTLAAPAAQVREIGNQVTPEPFRWTAEALLALQEVRTATIPAQQVLLVTRQQGACCSGQDRSAVRGRSRLWTCFAPCFCAGNATGAACMCMTSAPHLVRVCWGACLSI